VSEGVHRVGTSGWTYKDWPGVFYPEGVAGPERLAYYVEQFDTVEINASFYNLPYAGVLKGWTKRIPDGYHVSAKGSQYITHYHRLVDPEEPLGRFFDRMSQLPSMKVCLWQLPPSMWKDDIADLAHFLGQLPPRYRHAVEFRHESWWSEDVVKLLAEHNAAFVGVSHPKLPGEIPVTADFLYLRFHGTGRTLYNYDYSDDELSAWAGRVRDAAGSRDVYAYFNNSVKARSAENARRFRELLGGQGRGNPPRGDGVD